MVTKRWWGRTQLTSRVKERRKEKGEVSKKMWFWADVIFFFLWWRAACVRHLGGTRGSCCGFMWEGSQLNMLRVLLVIPGAPWAYLVCTLLVERVSAAAAPPAREVVSWAKGAGMCAEQGLGRKVTFGFVSSPPGIKYTYREKKEVVDTRGEFAAHKAGRKTRSEAEACLPSM